MKSAIADREVFQRILYAQAWEDPDVLCDALEPGPGDHVFSVAAAGDNTLALLLREPAQITALDLSMPQIALCELKIAGIRTLDYAEFLELMGVFPSDRRSWWYRALRPRLSATARAFFDTHSSLLDEGLISSGKFEKYFELFRTKVLRLVHNADRIEGLLAEQPIEEQARFYEERWDSSRWRLLFKVFFSKRLMGKLGRDESFFAHVEDGPVSERFLKRTHHCLTTLPAATNWFLEFILTGRFRDPHVIHPYLRPDGFARLKNGDLLDRVELVQADMESYLPGCAAGTFDAFNLSDVFEYMDAATAERMLREMVRAARPGARLAYWNLLVPREAPESMDDLIVRDRERAAELHGRDRAWFYERFVLERVR